ncbi:MAG: 5'-nucleotidase, partial [Bacteroidota bacterium]
MKKNKPESYLTNLLGDLLLAEGERVAAEKGFDLAPSVSFFNYGGIRTFLPKGEITVGKIFELMPFENEMVFLKLTGAQLQEFLDYVAAGRGGSMGGARFTISDRKAINAEIGSVRLNPEENYWLVTNDYVANGGDDLEMLKQCSEFINSGVKIRDVIIAHLKEMNNKNELLTSKLDGRISYE